MILLFALLLGLVHGSYLATAMLRAGTGGSALAGRSRCDSCGAALGALDLVPLLGWAVRRGRCRACGARIDPLHPIVELGTALAWAGIALAPLPPLAQFSLAFLLASSAALIWTDLKFGLLPDALVLPLAAIGALQSLASSPLTALAGCAFAGGLLAVVRYAFLRLCGREALGLGDVKLFAALGLWIGPEGVGPALLAGALATLAVALLLRAGPGRELPFGPGLLFGAMSVLLIQQL